MNPTQAATMRRRAHGNLALVGIPATSTQHSAAEQPVSIYADAPPRPAESGADGDSRLRRMLAVADLAGATTGFAATFAATVGAIDPWTLLAAAAVVIVNKLLGLYDRDSHLINKTTIDEVPRLLNSAVILAFITAGVNDRTEPAAGVFSARTLLTLVVATAASLALARLAVRRVARARLAPERCIVVGDRADCDTLRRKLALSPTVSAQVVGRTSLEACAERGRTVREAIARAGVTRLIVVPGHRHPDDVGDAIRAIRSFGVKISLIPPLADAIGGSVEHDHVCGVDLVGVKDMRLSRSSIFLKRATDAAAAALGLLLFAPFFAVVAIAIKLDSAGPVFYRQRRVGRDGDEFAMVKFRTMVDGADRQKEALRAQSEAGGLFKMTDDPRVTRAGRFLRHTSLDELPQLFNVLRGDMSLVGPRPLVPDEDFNITGWYRRRSQITPGMTGVWQLHGPIRISLDEMVKIDYQYVANWSIWSDLKILAQTVPHVFGRRGL